MSYPRASAGHTAPGGQAASAGQSGAMASRPRFPEIEPYATGRIALDAVHTMHWDACGNADGVPLVFLHGGPGGGCLPHHRRFYDPAFWKIVLYDQRGAGRSAPRSFSECSE
jgi:pimeloyl-ACP methyl ester carboxylesterase